MKATCRISKAWEAAEEKAASLSGSVTLKIDQLELAEVLFSIVLVWVYFEFALSPGTLSLL